MPHAISNGPFALVRDHCTGTDTWKPWSDGIPYSRDSEVLLTVYDFWFARDDEDVTWAGPFRYREQAQAFTQTMMLWRAAPTRARTVHI